MVQVSPFLFPCAVPVENDSWHPGMTAKRETAKTPPKTGRFGMILDSSSSSHRGGVFPCLSHKHPYNRHDIQQWERRPVVSHREVPMEVSVTVRPNRLGPGAMVGPGRMVLWGVGTELGPAHRSFDSHGASEHSESQQSNRVQRAKGLNRFKR